MNEIIWLPTAQKHLHAIYNWLAERSETAATRLFNDILNETERLTDFPEIAKKEPILKDFTKEFRALVVRKNFKIIYYIQADKVYISAVWDCRQDPSKLQF
ncbi:MAG: type II toxin-antitoxin system RelE/ParE family toxin [Bacteroidia bacterium]|nr:type II toxin-antitoxin system RelE/ParE family toxin [Bacteroidia bacterium]